MMETTPTSGKFNITARLFKLVSDMPKDQQLILLSSWWEKVLPHICIN